MKITFFEVSESEQGEFTNLLTGFDLNFTDQKLNTEGASLALDSEVISVFINSKVDKSTIDLLPNLKLIATRSTGFDHIDVEYAKSKGITISTVPSYGSNTVAEFTFGLLLNVTRKIAEANHKLREEDIFSTENFKGMDLFGKTLGVVGTGKIGKNVIRIGKGFGMNVIAYDLYPDQKASTDLGFAYKTLEEVLSSSDVITLHAPYTKENHHMINKTNIKLFKKGVVLINTARGELIDTEALIWALNEKIIRGAGLDVFEGERYIKEEMELLADGKDDASQNFKTLLESHVIMHTPNVIVTPHIAFHSAEAVKEILKITATNISSFSSGTAMNVVK